MFKTYNLYDDVHGRVDRMRIAIKTTTLYNPFMAVVHAGSTHYDLRLDPDQQTNKLLFYRET